jgi:hypothetical protein
VARSKPVPAPEGNRRSARPAVPGGGGRQREQQRSRTTRSHRTGAASPSHPAVRDPRPSGLKIAYGHIALVAGRKTPRRWEDDKGGAEASPRPRAPEPRACFANASYPARGTELVGREPCRAAGRASLDGEDWSRPRRVAHLASLRAGPRRNSPRPQRGIRNAMPAEHRRAPSFLYSLRRLPFELLALLASSSSAACAPRTGGTTRRRPTARRRA